MKKVLCLLSLALLCEGTVLASPPGQLDQPLQMVDVFQMEVAKTIVELTTLNQQLQDVIFNNFSTESASFALLPAPITWQRTRVISYNKKLNRARQQLYGDKAKQLQDYYYYTFKDEDLPELIDLEKPAWERPGSIALLDA